MNILTIVLSFLPGFAWLALYLQEDDHPESKSLIAETFAVGLSFAFFGLIIQIFINCAASSPIRDCLKLGAMGKTPLTPTIAIIFAFLEEILKFGAAYFTVHKSPDFKTPVDAMIYMAVAALGFATLENFGALSGIRAGQTSNLLSAIQITSLRFAGATLLHTLTSAIVGYHWAVSIREFGSSKYVAGGLLIATALHVVFNYLIITYGNITYAAVFLLTVAFFVLNDFEKLKQSPI